MKILALLRRNFCHGVEYIEYVRWPNHQNSREEGGEGILN